MTMTRNLGDTLFQGRWCSRESDQSGLGAYGNRNETQKRTGLAGDWYNEIPRSMHPQAVFCGHQKLLQPLYWLADESGPVSGQVVDLEQYPFIGRNPPKDETTMLIHNTMKLNIPCRNSLFSESIYAGPLQRWNHEVSEWIELACKARY